MDASARGRNWLQIALTSGLLACFAACSSTPLEIPDEEPGQGTKPPPAPGTEPRVGLAELGSLLAETQCQQTARCCRTRGVEQDTAACTAALAVDYQLTMQSIGALAVRYDERRAAACIDAIAGWLETCTLIGDELVRPPCDTVFNGTLEEGAPCTDDLECADTTGRGAFCETTTGTCVPRALEGEVCLAVDCAKGLYCDLFAGVCSSLRTSGECQLISACAPGYACSPDAECIPKLEDGEACQLDLQCNGGICDANARCAPALSSALVCGG